MAKKVYCNINKYNGSAMDDADLIGQASLVQNTWKVVATTSMNLYDKIVVILHRTTTGYQGSYNQMELDVKILKNYSYVFTKPGAYNSMDVSYASDTSLNIRSTCPYSDYVYVYGIRKGVANPAGAPLYSGGVVAVATDTTILDISKYERILVEFCIMDASTTPVPYYDTREYMVKDLVGKNLRFAMGSIAPTVLHDSFLFVFKFISSTKFNISNNTKGAYISNVFINKIYGL